MDSGVTSKVIGPDFTAIAASLTSTTATSPAPSPSQTSSGNTGPPDWGISAASSSKMNQDVFCTSPSPNALVLT
ncbi:hypothetical protein DL96DRAFT_1722043 [Flagelloscypha sp. PMI_526]|nr:hypothetical protein DL96DRAFT_1722043 [Flagelloscypha sp. PMI_526]